MFRFQKYCQKKYHIQHQKIYKKRLLKQKNYNR